MSGLNYWRNVTYLHNPLPSQRMRADYSYGTGGFRGKMVLNGGRFYWEVNLTHEIFGTSMVFGIGIGKLRHGVESDYVKMLGEDMNSWGLSHNGLIYHGGEYTQYTEPIEEDITMFGVLFDGVDGTLTFYKDTRCLGVAFHGLQNVHEPLYPIICNTNALSEMKLNVFNGDFEKCHNL